MHVFENLGLMGWLLMLMGWLLMHLEPTRVKASGVSWLAGLRSAFVVDCKTGVVGFVHVLGSHMQFGAF